MKPHIAILADFDTTKRPRPHRMIESLKSMAHLYVIARETSPESGARCFSFPAPTHNAQTRTKEQNEKIRSLCEQGDFAPLIYTKERECIPTILRSLPKLHLIIVEDIVLLPFACDYKRESSGGKCRKDENHNSCKILVDLREFYPLEYEDPAWLGGLGKLFSHLCTHYLPQADACLCVSEPIAARYEREFGVKSTLYYSLPPFYNLSPSPIESSTTPASPLRLIYHGLISAERGSTNLLELARLLGSGYELSCMVLSNNTDYLAHFIRQAESIPNLTILPPVCLEEIVPRCNEFDIGVISLQDSSFNNKNAMPNKLFEYIQSRLCVISTPLDSLRTFFARYPVGRVAQGYGAPELARAITSLSCEEILEYKRASHTYARELSLETNAQKARDLVRALLD